jgi:hypothetical protein
METSLKKFPSGGAFILTGGRVFLCQGTGTGTGRPKGPGNGAHTGG